MTTPEILNTTIFNTEDVLKILHRIGKSRSEHWEQIKIRYKVKPHRRYIGPGKYKECWATIKGGYGDKVEIGLLKPQKWGDNVLQVIANQDDEFAHRRLVEDLIYALQKEFYDGKDIKPDDYQIRMSSEESEGDKLRSTYYNAKHTLKIRERDLENYKKRLPEVRRELEQLEKAVPALEKTVASLKNDLAKKEAVMRSKKISYS